MMTMMVMFMIMHGDGDGDNIDDDDDAVGDPHDELSIEQITHRRLCV
jgi:hypothetical protein